MFSAATVQLCRRLVFLGPAFRPPQFNFVIDSSFWGQLFGRHGSTLSSNRLFGASAGSRKFPYHQEEIRFFQKLGFLDTINPFIPKRSCTERWYEDFRSPALGLVGFSLLELSDDGFSRYLAPLVTSFGEWYRNFRFLALVLCQCSIDG
jgi:hypothetical protein